MDASPLRSGSFGVALLALAACASAGGTTPEPARAGPQRVLFVGNSLTYVNDLPHIVAALAQAAGTGPVETAVIAFPDFGLEDHWRDGRAAREIARGRGWDVVVLQQGPSALGESRAALLDFAARFDSLIRRAGATPALYMVWPARSRLADFDRVSETYRLAAEAVGGTLLPCGEAWRAAWRTDAALPLYGPDGFHPSPLGSYAAALVIVQRLTGRSPVGLPRRLELPGGATIEVGRTVARLVQEAAAEANSRF